MAEGNQVKDYKDLSLEVRTESEKVSAWRARISRHGAVLRLPEREKQAERLRQYLSVQPDTNDRVYLPYLKPALVDMHLRTLPAIPSVAVEARSEAAEQYEEQIRALVDANFSRSECKVRKTCDALQWDDDFWGDGFGKVQWKIEYSEPVQPETIGDDALDAEIARAMEENAEPSRAQIAESDIDSVHIKVHEEALNSPVGWDIYQHIQQHIARNTVVHREWAQLGRVHPARFVYDTDVPWEERSFEAELRSVRVSDMIAWGYRNINIKNCPPNALPGQSSVIYEEMTAPVWEIHDRENDKFYVISARGPETGLFLHKSDWSFGKTEVYLPLVFNTVGEDQLHGVPVAELLSPVLDELARVDFHIRRHVKNHADYKLGGPGSANDPAIKAGLNDPDRKFVFEGSPEAWALMKEIKPPALPGTLLEYRSLLLDTMRRVTAVDAQNMAQSFEHQITATESGNRQEAHNDHKADRQEIMSDFLSRVATSMLGLYRHMATMGVVVRVMDTEEQTYSAIKPDELPEAVDVAFDIRGESEAGRAEQISAANAYKDFLMQIGQESPTDWDAWRDFYGRKLGIRRPGRFHAKVENVTPGQAPQAEPGSPGVKSSAIPFSQAVVQ